MNLERHEHTRPLAFLDLSRVYAKFRKPLLKYVLMRIGNHNVAEELIQDVFLKAHRNIFSYQPHFRVSTWLWTIARNTVTDWIRKEGCLQPTGAAIDPDEIASPTPDPEAKMANRAIRTQILLRMNSLTDLQKKALTLRVFHHLSYHEIAERLRLTLPAVKCLIHRATTALDRAVSFA